MLGKLDSMLINQGKNALDIPKIAPIESEKYETAL